MQLATRLWSSIPVGMLMFSVASAFAAEQPFYRAKIITFPINDAAGEHRGSSA